MNVELEVSVNTQTLRTVADSGDLRPPLAIANESSAEFRESLHALNRRYQEAWDRAERLQDELDDIKRSLGFRILTWWRQLARPWRPAPQRSRDCSLSFATENLDQCRVPAVGTVSILIPFRDRLDLLKNCLRSLRRSSYPTHEILLLDNESTEPRLLRFLKRLESDAEFKVFPCPGPFNFAKTCNRGAETATGDFLLFLNNDTEVISPDWLDHLLQLANAPAVGVTGATLLYPDGTLQHAGIVPTSHGDWRHIYRGLPGAHAGTHGELSRPRTVPAVTGACLMIRRDLFAELGGFDERYAVTLNDVDLCRRVRERGLKVAISPHARLYHFESLSRGFSRVPRLP